MEEKNKRAFWTAILAALALCAIPSTVLLDSLQRYRRFLDEFESLPLRNIKMRSIPHREAAAEKQAPIQLQFVEFKLKAPKAKKVHLVGEFNGWKEGSLALAKQGAQDWSLTLPLPPGSYRYLYVVDGEPRLDPESQAQNFGQKKVSVKAVR